MMKMTRNWALALLLAALMATPALSEAKVWKASLAQMPVYAESHEKGALVDLVKALSKVSGDEITYQVVAFPDSIGAVETGAADFHLAMIQNPALETGTDAFDYSTTTLFHVNFMLYSREGLDVTPVTVAHYKVATEAAHTSYFPFPTLPSTSIEDSLKKVDAGELDAFIFAAGASDPIVARDGLSRIKRQLFRRYDVKVVLPKGGRGGPTDHFLSDNLEKLSASGELTKIVGPIDEP